MRHFSLATAFFLLGCTQHQTLIAAPSSAVPAPSLTPDSEDFERWRTQFSTQAEAAGIPSTVVSAVMAQAHYRPRPANAKPRPQAEFDQPLWDYLAHAVSPWRVARGQALAEAHRALLQNLEAQYGVPWSLLVSIWGIESAYGKNTGHANLPTTLAAMMYEGRRQNFARTQMLSMMRLVARGDVQLDQLYGSWAGGMGNTQFIPSTYLHYAVDYDGDGRRNLWGIPDALASTAYYLKAMGWRKDQPWGAVVTLPAHFSDQEIGQRHALSQWRALGYDFPKTAPPESQWQLWLPAGRQGPAFLLGDNFAVIRKYNNASSYALAVGMLADAIAGQKPQDLHWPTTAALLSRREIRTVQRQLSRQGFSTYGVDGLIGPKTRAAFRAWQRKNGQFADGFITQDTAQALLRP